MTKQRVTHTIIDRLTDWGREGFRNEIKFLHEQEMEGWEVVATIRFDLVLNEGLSHYIRYYLKKPFPEK